MLEETIKKIDALLAQNQALSEAQKNELSQLLSVFKLEVNDLITSHEDEAQTILHFIEASTFQAVRGKQNKKLKTISLEGLTESLYEFESTHPKLVASVNAFCNALAGMGV